MIVILGIGNPEENYKETRHNIGKEIVNFLFQKKKKEYQFSSWLKKGNCEIAKGKFQGKEIILAKNLTFMNDAGKCALFLLKNFKVSSSSLFVIHDDFDIPLGKVKLSKNRGSAGHKGVESIIKHTGTKNFWRLRIGIKSNFPVRELDSFVLKKFSRAEKSSISKTKSISLKIIESILSVGFQKTISKNLETL